MKSINLELLDMYLVYILLIFTLIQYIATSQWTWGHLQRVGHDCFNNSQYDMLYNVNTSANLTGTHTHAHSIME